MRQAFQWRFTIVILLAVVIALLLFAWPRPTVGQTQSLPRSDSSNGRRISQMVCINCHLVSPEGQAAVVGVPSFLAIANHAGQTAEKLAAAIIIPHPPMPSIQLTNSEMRDVIAYILSLRTEK